MNKDKIAAMARAAKRLDKDDVVAKYCQKKTVLDVGCIGQDRNYNSENWLHNKVKQWAMKVDGVDILVDEIHALRRQGYSMYTVDELQQSTNKYDVVLMADVIEHVDNPVEFLKFYASYLSLNGSIVITTPNANRANNFINILFNNNYSVNPEHTCWFCPKTFSEVVNRANLNVENFFWTHHYYDSSAVKGFYQKLKFALANLLISRRTNFSPNMVFILSNRIK